MSGRRDPRGYALVAALIYLSVMTLMSAAFIQALQLTLRETVRADGRQQAFNLAESGIEKAAAELRLDPGYRGEERTPLGAGRFSARVTPREDAQDMFLIEGEGEYLSGDDTLAEARVAAELEIRTGRVWRIRWIEESAR